MVEQFIETFDQKGHISVLETPGHDWSCLSYGIENYLFTGDSFIPKVKVVTKLRGGNRAASKESLRKILNHSDENTIICPGHGEMEVLDRGEYGQESWGRVVCNW